MEIIYEIIVKDVHLAIIKEVHIFIMLLKNTVGIISNMNF